MSCRGSSALRWSFRLVSRRLRQEATRRTASTSVLFRQSPTSSSPMAIGSFGIVQARFSSSDKCTEHKIVDCNKCSKDVSFDELTSLMKDAGSLRLVDVRESYELREAGRIPHAVNIPLTQLKGFLSLESELFQEKTGLQKPTKADSIVFYGMGSIRSVAALEIACKMGYKKSPVCSKQLYVCKGYKGMPLHELLVIETFVGHLQKVLQMKDEDFEHVFKIKKPKKDEDIIFCCKMGPRSNVAMKIAEAMGYTKARHYPGGWQEWSKLQGDRV